MEAVDIAVGLRAVEDDEGAVATVVRRSAAVAAGFDDTTLAPWTVLAFESASPVSVVATDFLRPTPRLSSSSLEVSTSLVLVDAYLPPPVEVGVGIRAG